MMGAGLLRTSETFVPLEDAEWDGDGLRVGYEKAFVKDAPRVEADGAISPAEQDRLFQHYDLGGSQYAGEFDFGTTGHDTSGPNTDTAMTRSEEQLRVGTEAQAVGRARLRKHVVTEHQQVTVPVSREEVTVEREPITDANRGAAYDGPEISEEEHEVTLHTERPVVDTEAVPVERVKLGTQTVTDQETVGGEVRKEQIEVDTDDPRLSDTDVRGTRR
jgi:uncharacterized protein (TIGR02271 family)